MRRTNGAAVPVDRRCRTNPEAIRGRARVGPGHVGAPAGAVWRFDTSSGPMAVRSWGSGPPVVLLHALALSGELLRPMAATLASEFRVLAPDLRGHGVSGWDGREFSVEEMALDIAEILDALRLPVVGMLGMSMGGSVAAAFAGMFPERVRSLVLADTTAWYGEESFAAWSERAWRAVTVPRERQVPFQVERWFSPSFQVGNPKEVDRIVRIFLGMDGRALAAASRALGRLDIRPLLPAIKASTLVMVGEDDYATPYAMAGQLAGGIPDASLMLLPGLRHLSLIERPALSGVIAQVLGGRKVTGGSPTGDSFG